jgi:signal transduction histidine kinase
MKFTPVLLRIGIILLVIHGAFAVGFSLLATELPAMTRLSGPGLAAAEAAFTVLLSVPPVYFWAVRPFVQAQRHAVSIMRDAVESISEGFQMYDHEDRLVLCNSKFREMYSLAADMFIVGHKFEEILRAGVARGQYPEALGRSEEWIAERMRQHRKPGEPIERRLPDGRWVKLTETRTNAGYTVGVRTDISELKNREQMLAKSEDRLRQIVGSLQDGFVLYDRDDRIVLWNEKWLAIHDRVRDVVKADMTFKEFIRACVDRRMFPEALGREEAFIQERIRHHRHPGPPTIRQLHDDRWYIIREVPTDEGGVFVITIDITELKNAERDAQEAKLRAEEADRAKSEFLTNMSHELRTPLNAVIGFSDIIMHERLGPTGNARYLEYARDINQSGRHLLSLINDILDLSKIESGAEDLYEEILDVAEVSNAAISLVRQRAQDKEIAISQEAPDNIPPLRADRRRLLQILVNILTNAIKFTDRGGQVALEAHWNRETGISLTITDNGIGIAAKDIPKAFSQFGQIDGALNRQNDGTGLGLPLAKALAEMHGGAFELESEPDVGTTVTMRFPASRIECPPIGADCPAAPLKA